MVSPSVFALRRRPGWSVVAGRRRAEAQHQHVGVGGDHERRGGGGVGRVDALVDGAAGGLHCGGQPGGSNLFHGDVLSGRWG